MINPADVDLHSLYSPPEYNTCCFMCQGHWTHLLYRKVTTRCFICILRMRKSTSESFNAYFRPTGIHGMFAVSCHRKRLDASSCACPNICPAHSFKTGLLIWGMEHRKAQTSQIRNSTYFTSLQIHVDCMLFHANDFKTKPFLPRYVQARQPQLRTRQQIQQPFSSQQCTLLVSDTPGAVLLQGQGCTTNRDKQ